VRALSPAYCTVLPLTGIPMLNATVIAIARNRITLDLEDRQETHRSTFANLKAGFSARGALTSSFAQADLDKAIGAEYRTRALMVWQALGRAFSGERLGSDSVVAAELKAIVSDFLRTHCDDLERDHTTIRGLMRESPNMRTIEYWRDRANAHVAAEIDMALLNVGRVEAAGGTVINIYQPSGVVQTGAGAVTTWTQHFGPSEREAVGRALDAVQKTLQSSVESPNVDTTQVLEVITDAKTELSREHPNRSRLQGAFMTIATTVQALGSAAPAYQLLKGAAALVGVTLP